MSKKRILEEETIKKLSHIKDMRGLYKQILDFEGESLYHEILYPWLAESHYTDFINEVASHLESDRTNLNYVHTTELYALTRVLDTLTLPFQEVCSHLIEDRWQGHAISLSEYHQFVEALGLQIVKPKQFHPFESEIFEAKVDGKSSSQTDTTLTDNFSILDTLFPAVMLNNLMIKRAGVIISLDSHYDLSQVNTSLIYWAYIRNNRLCNDLSYGWGNNSQWETQHRIDLKTKDGYLYNEDGEISLNISAEKLTPKHHMYLKEDNLTLDEGIELLKYRQLISKNTKDRELYPYDFKYSESTINN